MEKIDKLLEAVDHPERFSESELYNLLSDPEERELYLNLCSVRSDAFIKEVDDRNADTDREWERFKSSRLRKHPFNFLFQRKVVAAVLIVIASCSIIMVGVSLKKGKVRSDQEQTVESMVGDIENVEQNMVGFSELRDTVILFEDEKLNHILEVIAPYYKKEVDLKYPENQDLRLFYKWDSSMDLPTVINHLNSFDRINLYIKETSITDY